MTASVTAAFVHHAAAFLLFALLTAELVLMRLELTPSSARTLVRLDAVYGIAALVLLAAGTVRVLFTEKGPAFYFGSAPFIAKLTLFGIIALLSIYPTVQFLSWRKALARGELPDLSADRRRRIRLILHVELTLIVVLILCVVMAVRGIGFLR